MTNTDKSHDWTAIVIGSLGLVLAVISLLAALGYLHPFRQINRVTSKSLLPVFEETNECFSPLSPDSSLRFYNNRPDETDWVQCRTQNGLANSATYRFQIADLIRKSGISPNYRVVGLVGTFGVEVYSFADGALLHWVVRLDGKPICTVPENGTQLAISTVSVGPGECELVDEARPSLDESDLLTIDQVVDVPRDGGKPSVFGGIVRPELELQKK